MTFNDFILFLTKNNITLENIATGNVKWESYHEVGPVQLVKEQVNTFSSYVQDADGLQGYEEEVWKVYFVSNHEFYFKIEGYDNSYGKSKWTKFPYEVTPVEKTVVEYEGSHPEDPEGKLTFHQLAYQLKIKGVTNENLGEGDVDWYDVNLGDVKIVDSWGGEGDGERIGVVYYFEDHDIYLRIDGRYASHYGSDWDNEPYEVKPTQKTITVYEK